MSALPPSWSLTLSAQKRACVLDTPLVLSRHGLLLARRLGVELDVWLVRELWGILDNNRYYLEHPEHLAAGFPLDRPSDSGPVPAGGLAGVLQQWEMARVEKDLAGLKLFWVGDALCESLFPAGIDPYLGYRYETLAHALEGRAEGAGLEGQDVLTDCFRDTAALTAALIPYRSFILTLQGPGANGDDAQEPAFCSRLRKWGIRVEAIGLSDESRHDRQLLFESLARWGVTELLWAGLKLSVVHLVVPEAVIMPPPEHAAPVLTCDIDAPAEEADSNTRNWWADAAAFWYPL